MPCTCLYLTSNDMFFVMLFVLHDLCVLGAGYWCCIRTPSGPGVAWLWWTQLQTVSQTFTPPSPALAASQLLRYVCLRVCVQHSACVLKLTHTRCSFELLSCDRSCCSWRCRLDLETICKLMQQPDVLLQMPDTVKQSHAVVM